MQEEWRVGGIKKDGVYLANKTQSGQKGVMIIM